MGVVDAPPIGACMPACTHGSRRVRISSWPQQETCGGNRGGPAPSGQLHTHSSTAAQHRAGQRSAGQRSAGQRSALQSRDRIRQAGRPLTLVKSAYPLNGLRMDGLPHLGAVAERPHLPATKCNKTSASSRRCVDKEWREVPSMYVQSAGARQVGRMQRTPHECASSGEAVLTCCPGRAGCGPAARQTGLRSRGRAPRAPCPPAATAGGLPAPRSAAPGGRRGCARGSSSPARRTD